MTTDKKKDTKEDHKKETKETKEEDLHKKIKKLEDNEKELIDLLKRLQAEFENYKKRVDREKSECCMFSKADMIRKLLPFVDTFEIALKSKDRKDDFVKGMEMMFAELVSLLEKEGVRPIAALGKKLDPNYHDVLMTERSEKEDGTILEELQKGYMIHDRILRHSKVKVAKNNGNQPKNTSK